MRLIAYTRVSTEEQATGGHSLAAQASSCRKWADLYGAEVVFVAEEAGVSGKSLARPALQQALAMMAAGRADGLIAVSLDRLTRSVCDLGALLAGPFAEQAGVAAPRLVLVAQQIDTNTASGRMVANILASVAQWEREATVERTRRTFSSMKEAGMAVNAHAPLGFSIGEGKKLVLCDEEQAMLRRVAQMRGGGAPWRKICVSLAKLGYRNRQGGFIRDDLLADHYQRWCLLMRAPDVVAQPGGG